MLQYPSQQIVNNPLSYFSRPRQSHMSTSPERSRQEQPEISTYRAQSLRNQRTNSLPYVSAPSSRQPSPPRVTDSPVSMVGNDTEHFPDFDSANDPHNQPKTMSDEEEDTKKEPEPAAAAAAEPSSNTVESPTEDKPKEATVPESPKKEKEKHKRFTIHAALFGSDKRSPDAEEKKLKKARRRTLSLPKVEKPVESDEKEMTPAPATGEGDANGAVGESEEIEAHPAIRPLSLVIPAEEKGKERAIDIASAPVYTRCACCGKVKRPHGFNSELSPVLENENLRTNFSFEVDRTTATSSRRRSSDASRTKFTPIIPMVVGENETRQASVEPWHGIPDSSNEHKHPQGEEEIVAQSSPVRQPLRQNMSPARMKRNSAPPRFVRFASLHGRRDGDTGPIAEEDENSDREPGENEPLMNGQSDLHDSGVQTHDFGSMLGALGAGEDAIPDETLPEVSSASRAVIDPLLPGPAKTVEFTEQPHSYTHRSNVASISSAYQTPVRGPTPETGYHTPSSDPSKLISSASSIDHQPSLSPYTHIPSSTSQSPQQASEPTAPITILHPASSADPDSAFASSSWQKELTASFLAADNRGPPMDLNLNLSLPAEIRPKFSFESMRSANMRAEAGIGTDAANGASPARNKGKGRALDDVAEVKEKITGKRKSLGVGWLGGSVAVKA
jgi:hypothetical protein